MNRRALGPTPGAVLSALLAALLLVAGCSSAAQPGDQQNAGSESESEQSSPTPSAPADGAGGHDGGGHGGGGHDDEDATSQKKAPLRKGERFVDVAMKQPYTPKAPTTGTDDYRCFLLDPELAKDAFVTGIDIVPGQADVVHHVILFRVGPGQIAAAEAHDRSEPGQGWTCFGGSGLDGADASLDNAPWLGAWAPGGGEGLMARDVGIPLEAGSRIVMQVHYNLLAGSAPDVSSARLRLAAGTKRLAPLETMLLPGPVELPCRPGVEGPLCDRAAAVADVQERFGNITGQTANFLNMICQGKGASPVQTCSRTVTEPATVRAVAGHMHLLGKAIKIEVLPAEGDPQTILDIPVWDFDNQGSRPVDEPVSLVPGDQLKVTCEHDQALRDVLPAFKGQPERYVVWGEGTTDEMCLGIVLVTRP